MDSAEVFRGVITPNRSLSKRATLTTIVALSTFVLVSGVVFVSQGAWPVVGFLGLDIALLGSALWLSNCSGKAFEEITLTSRVLCVRNVDFRGRETVLELNPSWSEIEKEIDEDFGTMALWLVSHGKRYQIASFLSPSEKNDFFDALNAAMISVRAV